MISRLKSEGRGATKIKYIRGNLGLFNQYHFDTANIFGVKEGVIGTYPNFIQFIFLYKNKRESEKWYHRGLEGLAKNQRFKDYKSVNPAPGFIDKNNRFFVISPFKNYVFITMGKDIKSVLHVHTTALKSQPSGRGNEPQ